MKNFIKNIFILGLLFFMALSSNAQSTYPILPGSLLADGIDDEQVLRNWLDFNGQAYAGTLLYRRSTDGANSAAFHRLVDGNGPTLVIFKASNGQVFGGYNSNSWSSSSRWDNSSESFLFNLNSNLKGDVYYPEYSTYNSSSYGPTFGGGHDIYINSTMDGGSFFPFGYNSLGGTSPNSGNALQLLTGIIQRNDFFAFGSGFITEIEVYGFDFDISAPIVQGQDFAVTLDSSGNASITAQDIDTGSYDADGPVTLSIDRDTFNCDDVGAGGIPVDPTEIGTNNVNSRSIGIGFNPNTEEFWIPAWSGPMVYKTSQDGTQQLGTFNSGQNQMMQLWMDTDSATDYYTANYGFRTITKRSGSSTVWSYDLGDLAAGVSTDADYVYAMARRDLNNPGSSVTVLDKQTGQFVNTIRLSANLTIQGSFAVVNNIIYIGGNANSGTTNNGSWNYIHRFDMQGQYLGSTYTRYPTFWGWSFDGETLWISNAINHLGFKISDGNAYGARASAVTLTVTDPLGNAKSQVFSVTVVDDIVPTITLNGDAIINVTIDETFTDPEATIADNCTAELEITGIVDVNTLGEYTLTYKAIDGSGNESEPVTRTVNVVPDNQPPIAVCKNIEVSADANCEGTAVATDFDGGSSDPDGDEITYSVFPEGPYALGDTEVTLTVTDPSGLTSTCVTKITVTDDTAPLIVDCPINISQGNDAGVCAAVVTWIEPTASDNCTNAIDLVWTKSHEPGDTFNVGTTTVTYTTTDAAGNVSLECSFDVVVTNILPSNTGGVTAGLDPIQAGTGFELSANFNDDNLTSVMWYFSSDGNFTNGDTEEYAQAGTIDGRMVYGDFVFGASQTGVYTVKVVVTDACGKTDEVIHSTFVVIYDPTGGFLTGGGWIYSPLGALTGSDAVGKANFGLVSKYKTGKNNVLELGGNTNFQFKEGDFHFKSSEYDELSLVISGDKKATYRGVGTVNRSGSHKFLVTVIDGDAAGGDGNDKFRIKIWADGSSSDVVYDNEFNIPENADSSTIIGGGSIVIHKPLTSSGSSAMKAAPIEDLFEGFELVSWPNPSNDYFNIKLKSGNTIDKISIQVFDLNGRLVSFKTGDANKEYQIGAPLQSGLYFVNVVQANTSKQIKLIKY
jgi:hypothetical protein